MRRLSDDDVMVVKAAVSDAVAARIKGSMRTEGQPCEAEILGDLVSRVTLQILVGLSARPLDDVLKDRKPGLLRKKQADRLSNKMVGAEVRETAQLDETCMVELRRELVPYGFTEEGIGELLAKAKQRLVQGGGQSHLPIRGRATARLVEGGGTAIGVRVDRLADPVGQRSHYLKGQCPEKIRVGVPFSLLVSIVSAGPASAELKPFDVPQEGCDILLVVHAPGLRVLGRQRLSVHVSADGDSDPVMFELRADTPGPRPISITAWLGGSYLGELLVETSAERDWPVATNRNVFAEITTEPRNGAVSLVVRYDPRQRSYRFEFRDEDNPEEVTSNLAYDPGPIVERLVGELDELAKDRAGYSAAQTKDYLINSGAALWQELVPEQLRQQFWDRRDRIRQLTILADKDAVPWELLYPMDPGHDDGFLVEQFPVTRAVFGRAPSRRLKLQPVRFVLPEGSPPEARAEIEAMRRLLDPGQPPEALIAALTPLQDLISCGGFGLLHFACHNRFDSADGPSITLDQRRFTPTHMTTSAINRVLAKSAPTVFINACRSAGLTPRYNRLDGWADKFLKAGAAAFIGSLWAVSDATSRQFASELYSQLRGGIPLGEALVAARKAAAYAPGDPTWLAYTVYGDPGATVTQSTA